MYTSQGRNEFIAQTAEGHATLRRHYYGPHPIIQRYLRRMNLADIVHDCVGHGCRQGDTEALSHGDIVGLLVHNIIVSALPLYRIHEWAASVEPAAMGMRPEQIPSINDDRISRTLDAIGSVRARNLFFRLALRVMKDFTVATDRLHFDTTSVTLSGDYRSSCGEPQITHGHNKDGRPDLKQLVFGLTVSADGGVALLHGVWSGNRVDDTLHTGNVEALRRLLGRSDFIYVADSKLSSHENLNHIDQGGGKFVTVYPALRKEVKRFSEQLRDGLPVRWLPISTKEAAGSLRGRRPERYWACRAAQQHTDEGYRVLWVRSSHKREVDRLARQGALRKATIELQALQLNRGRLKTRDQISKAVSAIIAKRKVKRFLTVEILHRFENKSRHKSRRRLKRAGEPSHSKQPCLYYLKVEENKAAIKAEEKVDGVFPLVTNLDERYRTREVLEMYKYQPYVEKKFAALKSELCVSPMFLKKPNRVAAMLHVYFIAIVCASLIERTVRMAMKHRDIAQIELLPEQRFSKNPTCPRVLEAFTDLCAHEVHQQGQSPIVFPLTLTPRQQKLAELLGIAKSDYR